MVTRRYRCQVCRYEWDSQERISSPLSTVCAISTCQSPSAVPVYGLPSFSMGRREDRYVNGGIKLRAEFVGRESDGKETVYRTLGDAHRGELDKATEQTWLSPQLQARLAQQNVAHMRRSQGLLPGTKAAQVAQGIEDSVGRE